MIAGTLEIPIEQLVRAVSVGREYDLKLRVRVVRIEEDSIDVSSMERSALASGATTVTMRVLEVEQSE